MRRSGLKYWLLAIATILIILSACTSGHGSPLNMPTNTPGSLSTSSEPAFKSPTQEQTTSQPVETPTQVTETPVPQAIDWQNVPILPDVSQHVIQIFNEGQAQGRDPHSFSVIGDCQAINFVFMGPLGRGELQPGNTESYLYDAINQFKDSFNRESISARGGFTAASILSPIQADPHYCKPGETPLSCEVRVNNPAYAFITLETWLDPSTIARYETYLRQILDYLLAHGVVPILMTKADSAEMHNGTHVINPAIVRVAYDYDVPVINFWRSAQYLPNYGIDPNREGFHLSQAGYDLKNILALRTLYKVWKTVDPGNAGTGSGITTPGVTPTPSTSPSAQPPLLLATPDCSGGCVFFATASSQDGVVGSQGVYAYEYTSQTLVRILGTGFDLQDVSKDGKKLLVNNGDQLYEINLTDNSNEFVSGSFYALGSQGAYWNSDDSRIIFLDQNTPLQTKTGTAINLYPSTNDGEQYVESGSCTSKDFCQSGGVYRFDSGSSATLLDSISRPVFSPDGKLLAYLNPAAATKDNYFHIGYLLLENHDQDLTSRRVIYFPIEHGFMFYPAVREYAFSPDSSKLFIIYDVYSAYYEKSLRLQTYLLDLKTGILYDFGSISGGSASLNPHLVWSPDGKKVLFFLANVTSDNQYEINVFQTSLDTGTKMIPYDQAILTSSNYFYITNIYWR
jgi:hypothetical protein